MKLDINQEPRSGNSITGTRFEIRTCRTRSRGSVKSTSDREVEHHLRHDGISGSSALYLQVKVKTP
jgi:hypothetical protein